jgi:hypothetical protein
MPRIVLVQVKRQMLNFKFSSVFLLRDSVTLDRAYLSSRSLDEGGFMVKMGRFVR